MESKDYFWRCSETGNLGIEIIKDLYKDKKIIDVQYNTDYQSKEIDLIIDGTNIEVKTDNYEKSGNICVETVCNSKPSWIYTTEADYIYYIFPSQCMYILYVDEFRAWFDFYKNEFKKVMPRTTSPTGEFWYYNECYLVPRQKIEESGFVGMINLQKLAA